MLIVQKYGGSSVGTPDRIKHVAERVARYRSEGHRVVVVVSAMRGVTDNLLEMARTVAPLPNEREMDVLLATGEQTTIALTAMALHALNVPAVSLTGAQAGIITNEVHTKARIQDITPEQIRGHLDGGHIVIVAGFQGQTLHGQITTLGRGGSDLTAIALAAALGADLCQIFTDVDGVYTADPRLVPNARKMEEISYDEMLELAGAGAKVMQSRAVEFAKNYGVPFAVCSSLSEIPGTMVKAETKSMEDVVIRGVTLEKSQARLTLVAVPDRPGVAARIFKAMDQAAINVDMIVQNISHGAGTPSTDLSFTVDKADLDKAREVIGQLQEEIQYQDLMADEAISKLSIVGVGMRSHPGIAAKLFEVLSRQGINIIMISTSEIKISVVIDLKEGERAAQAVHRAFLEEGQAVLSPPQTQA